MKFAASKINHEMKDKLLSVLRIVRRTYIDADSPLYIKHYHVGDMDDHSKSVFYEFTANFKFRE